MIKIKNVIFSICAKGFDSKRIFRKMYKIKFYNLTTSGKKIFFLNFLLKNAYRNKFNEISL
jgi:hypothetical protein